MPKINLEPLIGAFGNILGRAIEGAAEAVIDEVQDRLHDVDDRMTTAKKKVRARRAKARRQPEPEKVVVEVVDERRNH